MHRGVPSPFPDPGRTDARQGFAVHNRSGEIHLVTRSASIMNAVYKSDNPAYDPEEHDLPEEIDRPISYWQGKTRLMRGHNARHYNGTDTDLMSMLIFLDLARIPHDPARQSRIAEGQVSFEETLLFFTRNAQVVIRRDDTDVGGRITRARVYPHDFVGRYILIDIEVLAHTGSRGVEACTVSHPIVQFEGEKSLSSLDVRIATHEDMHRMAERGRVVRDASLGPCLRQCSGFLVNAGFMSPVKRWAEGRVMVDGRGMEQWDDSSMRYYLGPLRDRERQRSANHAIEDLIMGSSRTVPTIAAEDLWRAWPFLPAYSFKLRSWGVVLAETLSAPVFRTDAFDHLVLDQARKELVRALVEHHGDSFEDIVNDKSGGMVFLLYGNPGIGKTLTAEAVAETLHRPLYAIGAGDLGESAGEVEHSLRNVIDLANRWGAVLLIDEADTFLESRSADNLQRNAMVSVFLRLLDYHPGVLFLTTNRATVLDPAVHSRVSVSIHYPDLDPDRRAAVWRELLCAAGISHIEPDSLKGAVLNGRQIRSAIRIATTLSRRRGRDAPVTAGDFAAALEVMHQPDPSAHNVTQ
jgi:hypothetical protein